MFVQDAQPTTRIEIVEHHQSNHPGELGRSFRVYCWVNEYNPIGDIMNGERWNKPHKDIAPLLPAIFKEYGVPEDTRFEWSQWAGCNCGCSPGFIVYHYGGCADIHITYAYKTPITDNQFRILTEGGV